MLRPLALLLLLGLLARAAPVHEAAARGDLQALRQFGRADVNSLDEGGLCPLVRALQGGHPECLPLLLELGAGPNGSGRWSPLHEAAVLGDLESVQLLLKAGADPNRREQQNRGTALHVAAFGGHLEIARALLKAGAKPGLKDGEGLTPLFHAKDQAHPEVVKLLKAAGAR